MPFQNAAPVEELQTSGLYIRPNFLTADGCRLYVSVGNGTDASVYVATKPR